MRERRPVVEKQTSAYCRVICMIALSYMSICRNTAVAQSDWSPVRTTGDSTQAAQREVTLLVERHETSLLKGDMEMFEKTVYFISVEDRDSFQRAARRAFGFIRASLPEDAIKPPGKYEYISGPGDGQSGVYYVMRNGEHGVGSKLREYTVAVFDGRPIIVYDRYIYLGISQFDPEFNPPVVVITQWGTQNTIDIPPLDVPGVKIKQLERDIQLWNVADDAALARYTQQLINKYNAQVAAMEIILRRSKDDESRNRREVEIDSLRSHRDLLLAMTPGGMRERAVNELKSLKSELNHAKRK